MVDSSKSRRLQHQHQQQQQTATQSTPKISARINKKKKKSKTIMKSSRSNHTSNHAVILSSSRYWFNYRHVNNALAIYHLIKRYGGIPDENIILMLADEIPINPRNPFKNAMYLHHVLDHTTTMDKGTYQHNLLLSSPSSSSETNNDEDDDNFGIEIDYRGEQVTVENLSRVLLGLGSSSSSSASSHDRTLHTDAHSNILLYWTGHGGDGFFKFQDVEEITATDIHRVLTRLYQAHRYHEVLLVVDTCQAFTLADEITAPNVFTIGSSLRGENSYAAYNDWDLGVAVIERYTQAIFDFIQRRPDSVRPPPLQPNNHRHHGKKKSLQVVTVHQALVEHLRYEHQRAHVGVRQDYCDRNLSDIPLSDFFGNIALLHQQQQPQKDSTLLSSSYSKRPKTRLLSSSAKLSRDSTKTTRPRGKVCLLDENLGSDMTTSWSTSFLQQRHDTTIMKKWSYRQGQQQQDGYLQPTDVSFILFVGFFLFMVVLTSCKKW